MSEIYQFLDIEPFRPEIVSRLVQQAVIPVRRPLHGIELKKPVYANLQILSLAPDGSKQWVNVINSSAPPDATGVGMAQGTANFFVARVTHSRDERIQISQGFSKKKYLRVFGDAPDFVEITGALINSKNFPWRTEFLQNYDSHMRASQTVESLARIYLTIDDTIYEGHMVRCRVIDQAEDPSISPMAFVMFLTNVIYAPVGGAFLQKGRARSASDIRASSIEYVENAPGNEYRGPSTGTSEYDYSYSQDEYGNLRVLSNKCSSKDLTPKLYDEQLSALMQNLKSERDGGVFDPDDLVDLRATCRSLASLYGYSDGESLSQDAVRLQRVTSGQDFGGDARVLSSSDEMEGSLSGVLFGD